MLKWIEIGDRGLEWYAAVRGGWLVKVLAERVHDRCETGEGMIGGWDWFVAVTFVPDPEHRGLFVEEERDGRE